MKQIDKYYIKAQEVLKVKDEYERKIQFVENKLLMVQTLGYPKLDEALGCDLVWS